MNWQLFKNKNIIIGIWLVITIVTAVKQFFIAKYNNYLIFKHVFYHTLEEKSLYASYPELYFDHNHYGPIFSLFIAPFAILPDAIGMVLWNVFNGVLLIYALSKIPVDSQKINWILWICAHEFLTAILGFQFNPIMTALIILSFVFIEEEKEIWAAFCIVLGTFIKLYGIVGLAFFFFSKKKLKFIVALVIWSSILFVLPMLISSPEFILTSYGEWFARLVEKNNENASFNSMQDISIMGMTKRILNVPGLSNLYFIVPGLALFGLPYLRYSLFTNNYFRLLILASVLLFTVLFSSGSESPTYIIAFVGVAIWFCIKTTPISKLDWFLLVFALLLTSLSPSDLFPKFVRENYIKPYALKALPCVLIWFKISYELLTTRFSKQHLTTT